MSVGPSVGRSKEDGVYIELISFTRNVDLADIIHLEGGVTQNDLKS